MDDDTSILRAPLGVCVAIAAVLLGLGFVELITRLLLLASAG